MCFSNGKNTLNKTDTQKKTEKEEKEKDLRKKSEDSWMN